MPRHGSLILSDVLAMSNEPWLRNRRRQRIRKRCRGFDRSPPSVRAITPSHSFIQSRQNKDGGDAIISSRLMRQTRNRLIRLNNLALVA
jgi:hypothetical protein